MSEILSREEFERVKEYAEFRAGRIKEMGVSDLFEATGGGAGVPEWIPTIEALAAALNKCEDRESHLLLDLREKGWIE